MTLAVRLSVTQPKLSGTIFLEPSKSLSNRALIIRSLCDTPFDILPLSTSDDTRVLSTMLNSDSEKLFAGHAGSSYRFMIARACLGDREVTLEASPQLSRRPIGPLVRALQSLGADISYLNKDGFPPVRIRPNDKLGKEQHEVTLQAGVSSQYISALLMIAPLMPNGLTLHLHDEPVSVPYIRMTISMMEYFGATCSWTGKAIRVEPGKYVARDIFIESDWSAASYYYSFAALSESAAIDIHGLKELSLQGDQVVRMIYETLGVKTVFTDEGITILKEKQKIRLAKYEYDFSSCPDIAQTVMVTMAALGINTDLDGLNTLRIKETDRIAAMQTELARIKTTLEPSEKYGKVFCKLYGKAKWKDRANFKTYDDHRMAMAFAPLSVLNPIVIREPDVVSKSYPGFWNDIEKMGVKVERVKIK